ncbi:hypothetical protein C8F04DRAFT_966073 [Mycena alexandri]|uniref:DUF6589 domain-containing protein n=1 Tax=Mycena alexandri TaxID=1745969 RepID=A0AAD6SEZ9_9AGAR|nr:hypothetical protein C8F04DRAFT_966073 [Mycena alexandri]
MRRNYSVRPSFDGLDSDDFDNEVDASSTIGATSSPPGPQIPDLGIGAHIPFLDLDSALLPDDNDDENTDDPTYGSNSRAPKLSNEQKTLAVLEFMKDKFPRLSLRLLLTEIFTSDNPAITNVTNTYLSMGGRIHLLETAMGGKFLLDSEITDWIMGKATAICTREVQGLTDMASKGDHFEDAKYLRLSANSITVDRLRSFSVPGLLKLYERTTPRLQEFLTAVIGKDSPPSTDLAVARSQRNPDMGRTLISSMILNLRSRQANLHAAMNSLMLWDGRVPKRVVQTFNRYGLCASYLYQTKAVGSISKDALRIARQAANDPEKLLMLPYDNFNWAQTAWEASATHGTISHDQVSALLVILGLPEGSPPGTAARLSGVASCEQTARTRHRIPPDQALEEILPTAIDQQMFGDNAMKHVSNILCDFVAGSSVHRDVLPQFSDPYALSEEPSEEYFLPTYDQEQGSTRGNMLVIDHYFQRVLRIPKASFELRNYFLLGDRLTTARDRAAQDQRAVDRSEDAIDHLSSFAALSGIMHFVMNKIQNIGKNAWGGPNQDAVSLLTLRDKLPNRGNINLRKIDFYAWLRFLDVVLRALVLQAAIIVLGVSTPAQLKQKTLNVSEFKSLCSRIVAKFLLPSIDRLEAEEIKTKSGSTESGNAVLLMHDLMTIREMRHSIKHGHPERMEHMLKFWTPMFYAGGGYNYANEGMELLHNLTHDWPVEISPILRGGMLMTNRGGPANHKETDIRVEQFNKTIKSHAHGANASPGLLEKITPAIGHVQHLTEQIFEDLGVNDEDQHHAHVQQHATFSSRFIDRGLVPYGFGKEVELSANYLESIKEGGGKFLPMEDMSILAHILSRKYFVGVCSNLLEI